VFYVVLSRAPASSCCFTSRSNKHYNPIVLEISYIQPALIAGVNSTRLRGKWFLHFNRLFLNIAPRLRGCAVVATIIRRFLTYNADFAILRLWRSHRARLDTFVADIPLWDFTANNFRTHTVRS
jgi:hypothetical protein